MAEKRISVRYSASGGKEVQTEAKGIRLAIGKITQDVDRQAKSASDSAGIFEAAIEREAESFRVLRATLDPAYAAQMRYVDSVEAVQRAVFQGVATDREAAATLDLLEQRYLGVSVAAVQAASAIQQQIGASIGIDAGVGSGAAAASAAAFEEAAREAAAVDRLRASLDPAYAATRRFEESQETLARAVAIGATTQGEANRVLAQAKDRLLAAGGATDQAARRAGQSMAGARVDAANLGYQFQDIAVMLAAGQSPLMLAVQQGSQISQVLGPMGARGAVGALAGAFTNLLNPVTAITVATIALGATAFQWMTGVGEDAQTAAGALGDFNSALGDVDRYIKIAQTPLRELREEYGALAETIQTAARRMIGIKVEDALKDVSGILDPLTGDMDRVVGLMDELTKASAEIATLQAVPFADRDLEALQRAQDTFDVINSDLTNLESQLSLTAGEAERLGQGFEAMKGAQSLEEMTSAAASLLKWIDDTYDSTERLPPLLTSIYPFLEKMAAGGARVAEEADRANIELGATVDTLERATTAAAAVGLAAAELPPVLRESDAAAFSFASRWDEMSAKIAEARGEVGLLNDVLNEGKSILGGWGSAIGGWLDSWGPDGDMARSLAGMTDGVEAASTLIRSKEGFSSSAYWDVNAFRAGYGSDTVTLSDGSIRAITEGMSVTRPDAERDLQRRITTEFMPGAMRAVGQEVFAALSATQQAVLTSLTYNYGSLPDSVAAAVREGSEIGVATAIRALGTDNDGINRERRQAEAALYTGATLTGVGEVEAANAAAAQIAREQAEATREATAAEREATQARERAAKEAADQAARELGWRTDLLDAGAQQARDAEFNLSLFGKTTEEQTRMRVAYDLTAQAAANNIDLNELVAGTQETYGQYIDRVSTSAGRAAGEQERLADAQNASAESAQAAAAEMAQFVSSLTSMALGPITSNPIGNFLSSLPGFQSGAESVIGGFFEGGFGQAASALTSALGGATTGLAGLGSAIGAIAGPVGLGIGLFKGLMGTTEKLDEGLRVMLSGLNTATVETYETIKKTRFFGLSTSTSTNYDGASAEIAGPIGKAYAEVGQHILELSRFMDKGAKDFAGFSTSFELSLDGMTDEQKVQAVTEKFGEVSDKLARMAGATGKFVQDGETATETLERMVASFGAVKAAYATLFDENLKAGQSATELATKMVEAAGGLDAFGQAVQFYSENFLSVGDQADEAAQAFRKGLKAANINAMPTTKEEFTGLVDRLEDKGATAKMAALLALADEFVHWQDLESAALSERAGLERELLEVMGDTEAIRALERAQLDESNRALYDRINALKDEAAIASQRYDLETQLLQAQGNEKALRDRELAKLPEALRDLQKAVWAAQDKAEKNADAKSKEEAADAAADARAARIKDEQEGLVKRFYAAVGEYDKLRNMELRAFAGANRKLAEQVMIFEERAGLEEEYLRLTGNTEELHRRQLAALNPANRALQEMIWQIEKLNEAAKAMVETDFASLFDFQRMRALTANTATMPPLPTLPTTGILPDPAAERRQREQEVADRRAQRLVDLAERNEQLNLSIENNINTLATLARKNDKIGAPPVRDVA